MLYTRNSFLIFVEYFKGEVPDYTFDQLLNITEGEINEYGKDIVKQNIEDKELKSYFKKLKISLLAYMQFQDLFSISFNSKDYFINEDILLQNKYCYYESLFYLRQSILSLFNLNILSTITLLRPFIELSIFQLYWTYSSKEKGFKSYYKWIKGNKEKPPFRNSLEYVINKKCLTFPKLKNLLENSEKILKNLYYKFCSYTHVPVLSESLAAKARGFSIPDLEDFLYALHQTNILLHHIIVLYVICNPMILFPVKIYKKFGFNPPSNLYADNCNFKIIKKYLGEKRTIYLKNALGESEFVKGNLFYYNSKPDLTLTEIKDSWKDIYSDLEISTDSLDEMLVKHKVQSRAFKWTSNYIKYEEYMKEEIKKKEDNMNYKLKEEEFDKFYNM